MSQDREFDVVLFGATGFTGVFCCDHLAKARQTTLKGIKLALAGRNKQKIEEAARKSGLDVKDYPVIVSDSQNKPSLDEMCKRTKLVLSVVGPFTSYGEPLVESCVRNGCHYVDITGEFGFVRSYIEKYDDEAKRKGLFLLSCSAFDSLPSELTNMFLHQYAKSKANTNAALADIDRVELAWAVENPSLFSGGTMLSTQVAIRATKFRDLHPLSIMPSCASGEKDKAPAEFRDFVEPRGGGFPMQMLVQPSKLFGGKWIAPFLMSGTNEKVVRKNNILRGVNASYKECLTDNKFLTCLFSAITMFIVAPLLAIPFIGELLRKLAFFDAGEGPSRKESDKMTFNALAVGFSSSSSNKSSKKPVLRVKMHCPYDAYKASGIFCMEVAAALVRGEVDQDEGRDFVWKKGGALTPGCVIGQSLKERLKKYDISWEFIEGSDASF